MLPPHPSRLHASSSSTLRLSLSSTSSLRIAKPTSSLLTTQPQRSLSWWHRKPISWCTHLTPTQRQTLSTTYKSLSRLRALRRSPWSYDRTLQRLSSSWNSRDGRWSSNGSDDGGKGGKRGGGGGEDIWSVWQERMDKREEMWRRRMEEFAKRVEEKPYEALFGERGAMNPFARWRSLFREEEEEGSSAGGGGRQSERPKKRDEGERSKRTQIPREAEGKAKNERDLVFDPISNRMVGREQLTESNTFGASRPDDVGVDIPVKKFRPSETERPSDPVASALEDYDRSPANKPVDATHKPHDWLVKEGFGDESKYTQPPPDKSMQEILASVQSQIRDAKKKLKKLHQSQWPTRGTQLMERINSLRLQARDIERQLNAENQTFTTLGDEDLTSLTAEDIRANMGRLKKGASSARNADPVLSDAARASELATITDAQAEELNTLRDPYSKEPRGLETSYSREVDSPQELEHEVRSLHNQPREVYDDAGYSDAPVGLQTSYDREVKSSRDLEKDIKSQENASREVYDDAGYSDAPIGLQTSYNREVNSPRDLEKDIKSQESASREVYDDAGYSDRPMGLQDSYAREVKSSRDLEKDIKSQENASREVYDDAGYSHAPVGLQTSYNREVSSTDDLEKEIKSQGSAPREIYDDAGYSHAPIGLQTSYVREAKDSSTDLAQELKQLEELNDGLARKNENSPYYDPYPDTPTGLQTSYARELQSGESLAEELVKAEQEQTSVLPQQGRVDGALHDALEKNEPKDAYAFKTGEGQPVSELNWESGPAVEPIRGEGLVDGALHRVLAKNEPKKGYMYKSGENGAEDDLVWENGPAKESAPTEGFVDGQLHGVLAQNESGREYSFKTGEDGAVADLNWEHSPPAAQQNVSEGLVDGKLHAKLAENESGREYKFKTGDDGAVADLNWENSPPAQQPGDVQGLVDGQLHKVLAGNESGKEYQYKTGEDGTPVTDLNWENSPPANQPEDVSGVVDGKLHEVLAQNESGKEYQFKTGDDVPVTDLNWENSPPAQQPNDVDGLVDGKLHEVLAGNETGTEYKFKDGEDGDAAELRWEGSGPKTELPPFVPVSEARKELDKCLADHEGCQGPECYKYKPDNLAAELAAQHKECLSQQAVSSLPSTAEASLDPSTPPSVNAEADIEKSRPSSTPSQPTEVKILHFDAASNSITVANTTTLSPDRPISISQAFAKLQNPGVFLQQFVKFQYEGYRPVLAQDNLLILQSSSAPPSSTSSSAVDTYPYDHEATTQIAEEAESPLQTITNPIDGTTTTVPRPATGNFASPTGFVNHDPIIFEEQSSTATSTEPDKIPYNFSVQRRERVFSGKEHVWSTGPSRRERKRQQRRRERLRKAGRVLAGSVVTAAAAYGIGVLMSLKSSS